MAEQNIPDDWDRRLLRLIHDGDLSAAAELSSLARKTVEKSRQHQLEVLDAFLFEKLGCPEIALEKIEMARFLEPSQLAYIHWHATALFDLSRWPEAAGLFREIISTSKERNDIFFLDDSRGRLAICLTRMNLRDEALAVINDIAPDYGAFIFNKRITKADL